ncbi:MAG: S1/P1 nuclease, partial [Chitinophagaceae bacterium]
GGNRIRVQWFNDNTNLHSVWDTRIIDSEKLSYTEYTKAINFTSPSQRQEWQTQPLSDWFFESYQISRLLYDEIKEPNQKLS